jgi:Type II secretion system (T2SS), protein M subtype b
VLLVDQLDVRARPAAPQADGRQPARPLEVRLDISGFMRSRAP